MEKIMHDQALKSYYKVSIQVTDHPEILFKLLIALLGMTSLSFGHSWFFSKILIIWIPLKQLSSSNKAPDEYKVGNKFPKLQITKTIYT